MFIFIKKIIVLFFICLAAIIVVFSSFMFTENHLLKTDYQNVDYFIFGHSHAATSLNDTLLTQTTHKKFVNLGKNAQTQYWIVKGAEKMLMHNSASNIIIEFSNNSLTTNHWDYINDKMLRNKDRVYILKSADWSYLFKKNPLKTIRLVLTLPYPNTGIVGGYELNSGNDALYKEIDSKAERLKYQHKALNDTIPPTNKYYTLQKLIANNPKINFIVYRAPMHPLYYILLNNLCNEDLYVKLLHNLARYPNCRILDFGHLPYEDKYFNNLDHLNYEGSKLFTTTFADTVMKIKW